MIVLKQQAATCTRKYISVQHRECTPKQTRDVQGETQSGALPRSLASWTTAEDDYEAAGAAVAWHHGEGDVRKNRLQQSGVRACELPGVGEDQRMLVASKDRPAVAFELEPPTEVLLDRGHCHVPLFFCSSRTYKAFYNHG